MSEELPNQESMSRTPSQEEIETKNIYKGKIELKNKVINNLWWTLAVTGIIFFFSEIALFIYLMSQGNLCWQQVSFQVAWLIFFLALIGFVLLAIVRIAKED